jgi:hypothetical protein
MKTASANCIPCRCDVYWHLHVDSEGKRDPSWDWCRVDNECGGSHWEEMQMIMQAAEDQYR